MSTWADALNIQLPEQQDQDPTQSPGATTQPTPAPVVAGNANLPVDPKTVKAKLQAYLSDSANKQNDFDKIVQDYKKKLAAENGPFDATGTLNIIDNLYGTHYAAGNKSPLTPAEQEAQVMKAQDLANKERQAVAGSYQKEYGSETSAMSKLAALQARTLASQDKDSAKSDKDATKNLANAYEHTLADKEVAKARGMLDEYNNASTAVQDAATNPASANAVGVLLARYASGGSRINRNEIEQLSQGGKGWQDRINQIIQQAQTGTLTPENVQYAQQFLNATKGSNRKNYAEAAKGRSDAYADIYGADKSRLYKHVGLDENGELPEEGGKQAAKTISKDALSAYATKNKTTPQKAAAFLKGKGYGVEGF